MCDYNEDTIALKRSLKDNKSHFSEELLKLGEPYINPRKGAQQNSGKENVGQPS